MPDLSAGGQVSQEILSERDELLQMLRDERDETVCRYSANRMNEETDDNLLRVPSFTAAVNQCCR